MSAQATPFTVLMDIAKRSRALATGLPAQEEAVELWNGIGFMIAGERYLAPMGDVTEILHVPRYTKIPGVRNFLLGASNVRGRLLPVIDLAQFIGLPRSSRSQRDRRVLVIEHGDIFSGLVVDCVLGMQYFPAANRVHPSSNTPDAIRPFLEGGYQRGGEIWNVLSTLALSEDAHFIDVSQI